MKALRILLVLGLLAAGGGWWAWREGWLPADRLPGWVPPSPAATAAATAPAPGRRRGRRGGDDGPAAVLTAAAVRADVPVTLEAVGTAQALNTVTVRAQVEGRLLELAFREGEFVKKGDVLARVDPTIYQAQLDGALARRAQNEAALANAKLDLARYQSLAASNFGSKQQADTQRATVAGLEAQLKADAAAIDNARAYLDYTTIRSPLDGRVGIRLVDVGNLVRASDPTGLVTVTQLQPMAVLFNLPQQNLRAVNAAAARGPAPVDALDADNRTVLDRGALSVVDSIVDAATGTVKVKAAFPNAELQLWPGAFVNVRLTVDVLRDAVTVPSGAVQRGPNGPFVYVAVDDKAQLRPVVVTRQDETVAVIASGVRPPERVVTAGFARLNDGDRVRVADPEPAAPAAAPPPRRQRSRDGEASLGRERRRPAETPDGAGAPAPPATGEAHPRRGEGVAAAAAAPARP